MCENSDHYRVGRVDQFQPVDTYIFNGFYFHQVCLWMLQPVEKEKNLANMIMNYDPTSVPLLDILGPATGCGSVALNAQSGRNCGRFRAVGEAILIQRILGQLRKELDKDGMLKSFKGKDEKLIHSADPWPWRLVITIFVRGVCTSVPTFQNLAK